VLSGWINAILLPPAPLVGDSLISRTPCVLRPITEIPLAGVRTSVSDPWIYVRTNVTGTLNLLDLCRRRGIPKFVLLAGLGQALVRSVPEPELRATLEECVQ